MKIALILLGLSLSLQTFATANENHRTGKQCVHFYDSKAMSFPSALTLDPPSIRFLAGSAYAAIISAVFTAKPIVPLSVLGAGLAVTYVTSKNYRRRRLALFSSEYNPEFDWYIDDHRPLRRMMNRATRKFKKQVTTKAMWNYLREGIVSGHFCNVNYPHTAKWKHVRNYVYSKVEQDSSLRALIP